MMKFLRESTAEEFINALRPEDIDFAKELMKDLLHKNLVEEEIFIDENGVTQDCNSFFDADEYFKCEINYYLTQKRENNKTKKLCKTKRK